LLHFLPDGRTSWTCRTVEDKRMSNEKKTLYERLGGIVE
jgi:hypothetical protein